MNNNNININIVISDEKIERILPTIYDRALIVSKIFVTRKIIL